MINVLKDELLAGWKKMWALAALLQVQAGLDEATKASVKILNDANQHDALRAVAAVYVGRYGDLARRKALGTLYPNVSNYVQKAIYYSSRYWTGIERSNAKANWGGLSPLNALMTAALGKKNS